MYEYVTSHGAVVSPSEVKPYHYAEYGHGGSERVMLDICMRICHEYDG